MKKSNNLQFEHILTPIFHPKNTPQLIDAFNAFKANKFFSDAFTSVKKKHRNKFYQHCAKDMYKLFSKFKFIPNNLDADKKIIDALVVIGIIKSITLHYITDNGLHSIEPSLKGNYYDFPIIYKALQPYREQVALLLDKLPNYSDFETLKLNEDQKFCILHITCVVYNSLLLIVNPNEYAGKSRDMNPYINSAYEYKSCINNPMAKGSFDLSTISSMYLFLIHNIQYDINDTFSKLKAINEDVTEVFIKIYTLCPELFDSASISKHLDFLLNQNTYETFFRSNSEIYINNITIILHKVFNNVDLTILENIEKNKYIKFIQKLPGNYTALYSEGLMADTEEEIINFLKRTCKQCTLQINKLLDNFDVLLADIFKNYLFEFIAKIYAEPKKYEEFAQFLSENCEYLNILNLDNNYAGSSEDDKPLKYMVKYIKDIYHYTKNTEIVPEFFLEPINDYNVKFFQKNFRGILNQLHHSNKTEDLHKLLYNTGFEKTCRINLSTADLIIILNHMTACNDYSILKGIYNIVYAMNSLDAVHLKLISDFVHYLEIKDVVSRNDYPNIKSYNQDLNRIYNHKEGNAIGSENCLLTERVISMELQKGDDAAITISNEISYRIDVQRLRIKSIIENKKAKKKEDIFLTLDEKQAEIEFFEYTAHLINLMKGLDENYKVTCLSENLSFLYVLQQLVTLECPVKISKDLEVIDHSLNYNKEKMTLQLSKTRKTNVLATLYKNHQEKDLDNNITLTLTNRIGREDSIREKSFRDSNSKGTSDSVSYSQSYSQAPSMSMSFRANVYPNNPNEAEIQEALKTEGYQVIKVHGSNTYVAINVNELKLCDYTSNFLEALKKTAEKGYTKDRHDGLRKRKHTYSLRPIGGSNIDDRLESTKAIVSKNSSKFVILDRIVSHKESKKNPSKMKTMSLNDINPNQIEKL
ncbi:MAG: hypothetical protein J0G32_02050 [Alphaproteobacteria bacterium]|nr:hypothetical protein [Alphaproteobacteria bacterium]